MNKIKELPNQKLEWLVMLAPVLLAVAYGFEIKQIVHEQAADELNWLFMICLICIGILWIAYGAKNQIRLNIIQGILLVIANIILIILKVHYEGKS